MLLKTAKTKQTTKKTPKFKNLCWQLILCWSNNNFNNAKYPRVLVKDASENRAMLTIQPSLSSRPQGSIYAQPGFSCLTGSTELYEHDWKSVFAANLSPVSFVQIKPIKQYTRPRPLTVLTSQFSLYKLFVILGKYSVRLEKRKQNESDSLNF